MRNTQTVNTCSNSMEFKSDQRLKLKLSSISSWGKFRRPLHWKRSINLLQFTRLVSRWTTFPFYRVLSTTTEARKISSRVFTTSIPGQSFHSTFIAKGVGCAKCFEDRKEGTQPAVDAARLCGSQKRRRRSIAFEFTRNRDAVFSETGCKWHLAPFEGLGWLIDLHSRPLKWRLDRTCD